MPGQNQQLSETIYAKGRIFELVHQIQADGRVFEVARRAPGVRLIIPDKESKKILLTKEFRKELSGWDYRLPGGKVFDSLDEYEAFRLSGGDIREAAKLKAVAEGVEEAGVEVLDLHEIRKSTLGATVEWDLYVFEVIDWKLADSGQQLEAGEEIQADEWFSYDEVIDKIMKGEMGEERVAMILLQWINRQKKEVNSEV